MRPTADTESTPRKSSESDPPKLFTLLAVSDTPGITPGALSRDIILSSNATTTVIDRLETSGHPPTHQRSR